MSDVEYQDLQDEPDDPEVIDAEAGEEDAEGQQEEAADDPEIAQEAIKWGWAPKDQWKGDPSEHRSAEEYLNDPRTQRRIREASDQRFEEQEAKHRAQLAAMQRNLELATKRIADVEKGGHESRVATIKERIRIAADSGETDEVIRLTDELAKAAPPQVQPGNQEGQNEPPPEYQAWVKENSWFETDPVLAAEAQAVAARINRDTPHMPAAEKLNAIAEGVKARYPEQFGIKPSQPHRERPQKVAGGETRGGGGGSNFVSKVPSADLKVAKDQGWIGKGKLFENEAAYAKYYIEQNGASA